MSISKRSHDDVDTDCTVRASISFPKQQYLVLERIAADHRVSLAWVVRDAVDSYLKLKWPLLDIKADGLDIEIKHKIL